MTEGTEWKTRRSLPKDAEAPIWRDKGDDTTYLDDNIDIRGSLKVDGIEVSVGGSHPDVATHDALGLATDAELADHAAAGDPHTVYATNAELDLHTADTTDAHDASSVSVLDLAGTFTATDVEAALAELTADDVTHAALPNGHHAEFTTATHSAIGDASPHHAAAHVINSANHTGTLDDAQIPATIARDAEVTTAVSDHAAAADPHTNYQRETEKGVAGGYASLDGSGLVPDAQIASTITRDSEWSGIDFLVGTATGALSGEIVVGAAPGGELGGTWASPTVDASHSGSTHAATQAAAEATASGALTTHAGAADPHTGYQKESEKAVANGYASLGAGGLVPVAQLASGVPDGTKFVRDDGTLAAPTAALPELVYSDMEPEADVTIPAGHCAFIWNQIAVPDGVTVFIGDGAVLVITG